jgi:hypothetical protein
MISWASFTAFWHFYERSLSFDAGPESLYLFSSISGDLKVSLFESGTTVLYQFKSFDNHSRKLCAVEVLRFVWPRQHGWVIEHGPLHRSPHSPWRGPKFQHRAPEQAPTMEVLRVPSRSPPPRPFSVENPAVLPL